MISLEDYIYNCRKDRYEIPRDHYNVTFDSFLEWNNITNPNGDDIDWFVRNLYNDDYDDYYGEDPLIRPYQINEMLEHNVPIDTLVNRLNKELAGGKEYHIRKFKKTQVRKGIYTLEVPKRMYKPDDISDICDKLMWVFTQVESSNGYKNPDSAEPLYKKINNIEYAIITVEPVRAENKTKYVMDVCKGIVYHITSAANTEEILRTGLRMKGEKNRYRFINNRTYLICAEDEDMLYLPLVAVCESKKGYLTADRKLNKNIRILKIDVSSYNIDFYKDLGYRLEDGIVYSYTYFPPKLITDVTKELKEKLNL